MRRQSSLLLGWLLLAAPVAVQAQFTYTTNNGTITITGYTGTNGTVVIPDTITGLPVTEVGDSAFLTNSGLVSVTIPNTVTNIGDNAFRWDTGLTNVTVSTNVLNIGNYAFYFCMGLTSVTIPDSVSNIGNAAFTGCTSLIDLKFGIGITQIGWQAFTDCKSLTAISLPETVTSISSFAFNSCYSLSTVTISDSVTNISDEAFSFTGITNVIIGDSVRSLGDYAFASASTGPMEVHFKGNAPTVGVDIFASTGATIYYLPGTSGWGSTFAGRPTALWTLPFPLTLKHSLGVQTNGFSFTVSWATNASVVVDAATDLANPIWSPLATNVLNGGTFYFSDPQWTNYPSRFYRVRSQ